MIMRPNRNAKKQFFTLAMLLFLALSIYASSQAAETSLSGTVKDETGAVVPGATVTATNMSTKAETKVLANSAGVYNFPRLIPGKYKLAVQANGFKTYTKNVTLTSTDAKSLDVVMQRIDVKGNKAPTFSGNGTWALDPTKSDLYPQKTVTTDSSGGIGSKLAQMGTNLGMQAGRQSTGSYGGGMGGFGGGGFGGGMGSGMGGMGGGIGSGMGGMGGGGMGGMGGFGGGMGGMGVGMGIPGGAMASTSAQPVVVQAPRKIVDPSIPPPPPRVYTDGRPPLPPRPPDYKGAVWPPRQYSLGWFNTEAYDHIRDNEFLDVAQNALSTFSIDVDTASYSNVRRFLDRGQFPPIDAVRIEEFINYFDYEYKAPKDGKPFAAYFEIAEAPWNPSHRLLRIALKGREVNPEKRPNSNLVFLLDVSGSMGNPNKLPLVKQSMQMLVDRLTEADSVALVTYSTNATLYLPSTSGDQKSKLKDAIEQLRAGGSTNGAGGIQLAYRTAQENFIKGGINRVILATDGDFNVGITDRGSLTRLIEEKAQSGIFLSALGFGMGNLKDSTLELLADKGRGNYAYIDTLQEAQKVLVEQMDATLIAIAKDVKIQVEFNPRLVSTYRLIGYEDRIMAKEDFNNDAKKAGVAGAGHEVTALYELAPPGGIEGSTPGVDPLKYQKQPQPQPSPSAFSDEVATIKVRYKEPENDESDLSVFTVKETEGKFKRASTDFKFAAAVAAFGMILRCSPYKGNADFADVLDWANAGRGEDDHGYQVEFIRLVRRAMSIAY
jgi:Ca-activated chloride channel homolog